MGYIEQKGFTLLELLLTLSLISFLAFSGVYYHQQASNQSQLSLFAHQFYFDLGYAKEQAITKQQSVSICPLPSTSENNWDNGYEITLLSNTSLLSNTTILRRESLYFPDLSIQSHFGLNHTCVYFDALGQSLFNGHIKYTLEKKPAYAKITLTQSGKMHLEIG